MIKFNDLTGQRFGRWTVIQRAENKGKHTMWKCRCDCGTERDVSSYCLTHGVSRSCGCYKKDNPNRLTHGMSNTQIHKEWRGIKTRCYNQNDKNYNNYGGRGITMCENWKDNFLSFYEYVSKLPHCGDVGYSIDRIDYNGNYEPNNVRWADRITQNRNKRNNVNITFNGKTQCLTAWAYELNILKETLYQRIYKLNWNIEKALTTPVKRQQHNKKIAP